MAARNPTTWNKWIDENELVARKNITTTVPDQVADDQVYILDCEQMVQSICFEPVAESSGTTTVRTFHIKGKDICGDDDSATGEIEYDLCAYAWASDGVTRGEISVVATKDALTDTATVAVDGSLGHTSAAWRGFNTFDVFSNNEEVTFELKITYTSGGGTIYLAGVGIFANAR